MDPEFSFGAWLEKRRKSLDLTREELAQRAGCSISALRKIETDERRPSKQLAEILADCLDIPTEDRPVFLKMARRKRSPDQIPAPEPLPVPQPFHPGSPPQPSPNLPSPPTPLVGREKELAILGQLIKDPQCRIITLFGPGGIGKTRLAIQTALDQLPGFRNGVYFVGLSGLCCLDHVIPAIAEALQYSFYGPLEPKFQLFAYLRDKELLLVLDNFEQFIQSAWLVAEIAERSSRVKLLITSREQLSVHGEWTFEVSGLSYPDLNSGDRSNSPYLTQPPVTDRPIEDYGAVALFSQSASRARVGFKISVEDYPAVIKICRLVDGMPLALELAASWVRVLTCDDIARELEDNLDFLATAGWGMLERHKSMRAVFDHSWNLLSEDEQNVMGRLSVFRGEFTRQAAHDVAGASLAMLSGLITKSFLRSQSNGRYDLHELLRQYAESQAQIAQDDIEELQGRHSAYYLDVVHRLEQALVGPQQVRARAEFVADMDNIRTAWDYAVMHDRVEEIRGSIHSFWIFYETHTWYHEAIITFGIAADEVERTYGQPSQMDETHLTLYEYLRCCQGWFYLHVGNFQDARELLIEGVGVLRSMGTLDELSKTLHYLGVIYWQAGEYEKALEIFHEKLSLDLPGGMSWNLGAAYGNLGMVCETMGRFQEARTYFQQVISIYRSIGDLRLLGVGLFYLGSVENSLGMIQEGKTHLLESLELSKAVGDRFATAMAYNCMGLLYQKENNHTEAQRMFQQSLSKSRELNENWIILQSLVNLGFSMDALGDRAGALACFMQALRLASETQLNPGKLDSLAGIARVLAGQKKTEAALELVMRAENQPGITQETRARLDQLNGEIRIQFSQPQIDRIFERIQAKPLEAVIEGLLAGTSW